MSQDPLLLIVEDDEVLRRRLARAFTARGFQVAEEQTPEFVLLDLRIAGGSGLDLIPALIRADPATRIVVLTGYGSIATAIEAVRRGALHYLTKPADADEILAAFSRGSAEPPEAPLQPMSLSRVEWEHINRVLMDCEGNVSEAARALGLHRRSLQRKLSKYPAPR